MTPGDLVSTGVILLIVVTIAYGGTFLLKVFTGRHPTNDLQKSFFRAGHAHAGVLVLLGLLVRVLLTYGDVPGWARWGDDLVLGAAILMPAGFFLSAVGHDPAKPNRLVALVWLGAVALTLGLVLAGVGLIQAGLA